MKAIYEDSRQDIKTLINCIYLKFIHRESFALGALTNSNERFPEKLDSCLDFRIGCAKFDFPNERKELYNNSSYYIILRKDIENKEDIGHFIVSNKGCLDIFLDDNNFSNDLARIAHNYYKSTKKATTFYYPKK
ncbi:MAG: hypothetical protein PHV16_00660 [Candidatus Nanoarchaeia archaeon]|nr:hypothetical protein [Candidatus Nanoarchaeia archaeon]